MNPPLPQTFSQPTVQTAPAAAAGSLEQLIENELMEFMQSVDKKTVVARKRKVTSSEVWGLPKDHVLRNFPQRRIVGRSLVSK